MRYRGFTLVELLVAMALLALVMIALLNMLDTSTRVSKIEAALADTQENVRFAAYHIMRTARMMGGGDMPFARAGDDRWVAGQIRDDRSGSVDLGDNFGNAQVAPNSDILTVRGFFETQPFAVNRTEVDTTSNTVTIRERRIAGDLTSDVINAMDTVPIADNSLAGRGLVFMGMRRYLVGEVSGSSLTGSAVNQDRQLVLTFIAGDGPWPTLNPARDAAGAGVAMQGAEPDFPIFRVGVLQSYVYYVRNDFTLMRRRAATGAPGWVDEPVAVNIGSLQISVGLDTTGDGEPDSFDPNPATATVDAAAVTNMRIVVLGRTPFEVQNWVEPAATFQVPDDNVDETMFNRGAKWRRMDITANIRNFNLQG
jgi:prepilin-type N-terminal cleavage/methylation domain-containing protein